MAKKDVAVEEESSFLIEDGEGDFVIQMDDVEEAKYELIPKGTYDAEITDMEYKLSQASGMPMWALTITLTNEEQGYIGRKLFNNMSFSAKALPFTKAALAKIAPDVLVSPFKPRELAENKVLVGRSIRVKVDTQDYQGETRNQVKNLLPPSENLFG